MRPPTKADCKRTGGHRQPPVWVLASQITPSLPLSQTATVVATDALAMNDSCGSEHGGCREHAGDEHDGDSGNCVQWFNSCCWRHLSPPGVAEPSGVASPPSGGQRDSLSRGMARITEFVMQDERAISKLQIAKAEAWCARLGPPESLIVVVRKGVLDIRVLPEWLSAVAVEGRGRLRAPRGRRTGRRRSGTGAGLPARSLRLIRARACGRTPSLTIAPSRAGRRGCRASPATPSTLRRPEARRR